MGQWGPPYPINATATIRQTGRKVPVQATIIAYYDGPCYSPITDEHTVGYVVVLECTPSGLADLLQRRLSANLLGLTFSEARQAIQNNNSRQFERRQMG